MTSTKDMNTIQRWNMKRLGHPKIKTQPHVLPKKTLLCSYNFFNRTQNEKCFINLLQSLPYNSRVSEVRQKIVYWLDYPLTTKLSNKQNTNSCLIYYSSFSGNILVYKNKKIKQLTNSEYFPSLNYI